MELTGEYLISILSNKEEINKIATPYYRHTLDAHKLGWPDPDKPTYWVVAPCLASRLKRGYDGCTPRVGYLIHPNPDTLEVYVPNIYTTQQNTLTITSPYEYDNYTRNNVHIFTSEEEAKACGDAFIAEHCGGDKEVEKLKKRAEELRDRLFCAIEDRDKAQKRIDSANRELEKIKKTLAKSGILLDSEDMEN